MTLSGAANGGVFVAYIIGDAWINRHLRKKTEQARRTNDKTTSRAGES